MNKTLLLGLFIIVPTFPMDLALIDAQGVQSFAKHLSMAVSYGEQQMKEKMLKEDNSIHCMLYNLKSELTQKYSGNIVTMLNSDTEFKSSVEDFIAVDSNPLIQFPLEQIKQKAADVTAAQTYLIRTRQILAGINFLKKQPTYSNAWINEVNKNDRIGFMIRNQDYPRDIVSMKNYWSLFVYQVLIAPIIATD